MSEALDKSFVRAIIRDCEHTRDDSGALCGGSGGVEDGACSKTAILARGLEVACLRA